MVLRTCLLTEQDTGSMLEVIYEEKCDIKTESHTAPVIYDDVQEPSPKRVKIEKT